MTDPQEKTMHELTVAAFAELGTMSHAAASRAHLIVRAELANLAMGLMYCMPSEREELANRLVAFSKSIVETEKRPVGFYVASKTRHAPIWRKFRTLGEPIISTWIDEAGEGETTDYADLWLRCIGEATKATALILYAEEGDLLKGGFVEAGAALAASVPVIAVGPVAGTFVHHPLVMRCSMLSEAFARAHTLSSKRA